MAKPVLLIKDLVVGICEADGGTQTECAKMRVTIGVDFGEPETGRFGPPENYDPGSGDEIYVEKVDIHVAAAVPIPAALALAWAEMWIDDNHDDLAEEARGLADDSPDPDNALDRERDDRMTHAGQFDDIGTD